MITSKIKPGEKWPYITHKAHDSHPAGSSCMASRDAHGDLVLEFDAGGSVTLHGYYAAGIEDAMPADAAIFLAV